MGIEVDSMYGGAGSTFFASIVAIEELARVDPSVSVVCDVQNTLINEYFRRYASKELQEKYFPKLTKDLVRCTVYRMSYFDTLNYNHALNILLSSPNFVS